LEALALQSKLPDLILVGLRPADDPQAESTVQDFCSAHPNLNVRSVAVEIPGIVPAENAMLAEADADVVCFLDDDAIPRPFWLENISQHYTTDNRVGGVSGPAYDVVDGKPRVLRARFRNRIFFPGWINDQSTRKTDRAVRVDHFRGANMSFRLDALRQHGGFLGDLIGDDYRFELDACMGISRLGYRLIFEPEAEVDHHEAPRETGIGRNGREAAGRRAANETRILLRHWGRGFGGILHMLFAVFVGNFSCPGIAWGLIGSAGKRLTTTRHLLGLSCVPACLRGRLLGWNMAGRRTFETTQHLSK